MTIFMCQLNSEHFPKVNKYQVSHHDNHCDQAKGDVEPVQADTVNPWLKSKDKNSRDDITDKSQCNNRICNNLDIY